MSPDRKYAAAARRGKANAAALNIRLIAAVTGFCFCAATARNRVFPVNASVKFRALLTTAAKAAGNPFSDGALQRKVPLASASPGAPPERQSGAAFKASFTAPALDLA
jgi:hypothetical protein